MDFVYINTMTSNKSCVQNHPLICWASNTDESIKHTCFTKHMYITDHQIKTDTTQELRGKGSGSFLHARASRHLEGKINEQTSAPLFTVYGKTTSLSRFAGTNPIAQSKAIFAKIVCKAAD